MASDIQQLELASGIKDSLVRAGFLTIESILVSSTTELSNKVGVGGSVYSTDYHTGSQKVQNGD
jgi:hypothetical protein